MNTRYGDKIKGRVILITGGTGSFGNQVIGTLLSYQPERIVIFSRDEKKQFDMRNKYDSPLLRFVIGDVRDPAAVDAVVRGADYIFHAAALKQVPTCEFFPMEAVKTNIIGASNVMRSAIDHRVKRLVILSTDKAVYPINAMGMSKAMMEKLMIASAKTHNGGETVFTGVRYGNVLYSRGSVLPYFVSQIRQGKKLSVTNPEMTRFLLPLPNAVDLVLFALTSGKNGHMYIRKSPATTIETLARAVCRIFDHAKGYDTVGVRAGEKMHETLVSSEEMRRSTSVSNYYDIAPESQGLDYNTYLFRGKSPEEPVTAYTSETTERLNVQQTVRVLRDLPEIVESLKHHERSKLYGEIEPTYSILD